MLKHLIAQMIDWYTHALTSVGYPVIVLFMAAESTVVPLPSEVIIPPAAHLAATHQIPIGIPGIIIAGTVGSWLGATLMYLAARWAGRPLFMRYGKLVLITPEKIEGAENWARHYGSVGIFISRMLPVVRHLIGIPAGIVRMDYKLYSLFTILGSGIWCSVLCYVGVKMGQDEQLMKGELSHITMWLAGAMIVLGGLYYFFVHRHMKKKA